MGRHKGMWSSETSVTRFWSSWYGTLVVRHCIHEGTGINGTLMQNLDQYLFTNCLHVSIYSVSRFRACYLHWYVVLLLSIRLPKSKGIASVYFRFIYIAIYFNTDRFHDRNMLFVEDMHILYITFVHVYSTCRYFPRGNIIDLQN